MRENLKHLWKKILYDQDRWEKGVTPISNHMIKRYQDTKKNTGSYVSIIIPTKNAGPEFQAVLETIRSQSGVKETEIIILDSGSSDNTVDIAKKYQCRIFPIDPRNFHHGITRNFGAEQATGDFVLFMVQDAMPIGNDWLCAIIETFRCYPEVVAVTSRQVPRCDADMFASYIIWNHYHEMKFYSNRITRADRHLFSELSFSDIRKLAGIDDVCSCFKKEIFNRFKFGTLGFAEDLDLGIRLLEAGYSLAFLYSVGVTHSHNRDPEYFFQRSYVDSKTLMELSSASQVMRVLDLNEVLSSMDAMYAALHQFIVEINVGYPETIRVNLFFRKLKKYLRSTKTIKCDLKPVTRLEQLLSHLMTNAKPVPVDNRQFKREFSDLLDSFSSYAETIGKTQSTKELSECAYKLFGTYYGSHLGNLYPYFTKISAMQSIDNLLKWGI